MISDIVPCPSLLLEAEYHDWQHMAEQSCDLIKTRQQREDKVPTNDICPKDPFLLSVPPTSSSFSLYSTGFSSVAAGLELYNPFASAS